MGWKKGFSKTARRVRKRASQNMLSLHDLKRSADAFFH
jgi:hypothetical protein